MTYPSGQITAITTERSDYSYNSANNQLTAITGSGPKTCTYDANGNMLSDGTRTFVYDGLNRIIQVEGQSGIIASYGYDSSNRRIRKTVGSTTTHYLYDLNSQLIAETSVDGTSLREYIYLDGEPIALKEYQTNPGTYYFINDHLGTPQRLVDATGAMVWQAAYLPFGKAQVTTEVVKNKLRFPGQYFDAETGLHYNWHRFYDPDTGRYVSADPIGLKGGMNLYAYVQGNPVNAVDPEGLRVQECYRPLAGGLYGVGYHTYLRVNNASYGYYADSQVHVNDPLDPGSGWGVHCTTLRDDDCLDDEVVNTINTFNPPPYDFATYNCYSWRDDIKSRSGL
jgi:RHS repeat-associated protein